MSFHLKVVLGGLCSSPGSPLCSLDYCWMTSPSQFSIPLKRKKKTKPNALFPCGGVKAIGREWLISAFEEPTSTPSFASTKLSLAREHRERVQRNGLAGGSQLADLCIGCKYETIAGIVHLQELMLHFFKKFNFQCGIPNKQKVMQTVN